MSLLNTIEALKPKSEAEIVKSSPSVTVMLLRISLTSIFSKVERSSASPIIGSSLARTVSMSSIATLAFKPR